MMRPVTICPHLLRPLKVFALTFFLIACLFICLFQIASGLIDFESYRAFS